MTVTEIRDKIASRLNLTSTDALARIVDEINEVYRELVSSMGLETSIRSVATGLSTTDSQYVTFGDTDDPIIKVLSVYREAEDGSAEYIMTACTFDEVRNTTPGTWPPKRYAVSKMGYGTVEIFTDALGANNTDELKADCLTASDTMTGTDKPFFPENFHDVLVHGVLAIECDKMEKEDRAAQHQAKFEKRCGDLRMFIAKDAYLTIHQAKRPRGFGVVA